MKVKQLQSGDSINIIASQTVHIGIESLYNHPIVQKLENGSVTAITTKVLINNEPYIINDSNILEFENYLESGSITISVVPNDWSKNTFVTIAYNN